MKRGIFYTFLAQAPTLVLYFLSSTLMTRMLGDVGRGEFALLTNQVVLVSMLISLNLGLGITYFTSKAAEEGKAVIGTAATLVIISALMLPLLLWAISSSVGLTGILMPTGRTTWAYWGYVYAGIVFNLVNTSTAAVFLALKRFRILNGMSILNAGLSAIGFTVAFLVRDQIPPDDVFPIVLGVSFAVMLLQSSTWSILYALHVKQWPVPVWTWAVVRPILAFCLVGYFSNLINLVNYRFDIWVVHQYQGTASLGLYAVAVGVGQLLFYIPEPFSRVVQPYLFGQVKDEMLSRFKAVSRLNFTALLALAMTLGLLANWIIPLLYGDVFKASTLALRLLLPGILFSGTSKLLSQLVVQGGLQRFNLYGTSGAALLTVILDLLLIPRWGIEGAALASTCAYLLILVIIVVVIRYRLKISVSDLFLLRMSDFTALRKQIAW